MAWQFKKESYTNKQGELVEYEVMLLKKVNSDGEGLTTKDVLIGSFPFDPEKNVRRGVSEKTNPRTGKPYGPWLIFKAPFKVLNPELQSKVDQYGSIQVDFSSFYDRFPTKNGDEKPTIISKTLYALYFQPFIAKDGSKKVGKTVEYVRKLTDEEMDLAVILRKANLGWLDEVPSSMTGGEKVLVKDSGVPYWALFASEQLLLKVQASADSKPASKPTQSKLA